MEILHMSMKRGRRIQFDNWWRRNHHNSKGHSWLAKHAKRVAYAYNIGPSAFDTITFICKRFFNSDFKRLNSKDAWTLWKLVHPLYRDRLARLTDTAEHLHTVKSKHDKPMDTVPKLWRYRK